MSLYHRRGGRIYFFKQYYLVSENLTANTYFVNGMSQESAKDISEAEGTPCRSEVNPGYMTSAILQVHSDILGWVQSSPEDTGVLVICCCVTYFPNTWWVKTKNMYYVTGL